MHYSPPRPSARACTGDRGSLDAAKEFYASAAYEDALNALAQVGSEALSDPVVAQGVHQYRALCLIALGRSGDAEKTLEAMIRLDPAHRPAAGDFPPRLETLFRSVRSRVLPAAAIDEYTRAKGAFDARDYPTAATRFEHVLAYVSDPDANISTNPSVTDVRTLATGFLQLARAAANSTPEPIPAERAPAPPAASGAPGPAADSAQMSPPVALKQDLPRWPSTLTPVQREYNGVVEVFVTAGGDVSSVKFLRSVHPLYDRMIALSAKHWKFVPAMIGGKPVASSKTIAVKVAPPVP